MSFNPSGISHLMSERFRGYLPVVVDVETAGFNPQTDALLEVAATVITMDESGMLIPEDTLAFNIVPFQGANLEQAALDFTGIDPYDESRESIAELQAMESIFKPIRKAIKSHGCKRAILVGHNSSFDLSFVNAASERCAIKRNPFHPFSSFDTATLAGLAFGQTVLARACDIAGIDFSTREAHTAKYDTEKTAELFCLIVNRWKELGGWDMVLSDTETEEDADFM